MAYFRIIIGTHARSIRFVFFFALRALWLPNLDLSRPTWSSLDVEISNGSNTFFFQIKYNNIELVNGLVSGRDRSNSQNPSNSYAFQYPQFATYFLMILFYLFLFILFSHWSIFYKFGLKFDVLYFFVVGSKVVKIEILLRIIFYFARLQS